MVPEGIQPSVRGIQCGWPEHTDRCWTLGASVQHNCKPCEGTAYRHIAWAATDLECLAQVPCGAGDCACNEL